jgi:hypothetical protein
MPTPNAGFGILIDENVVAMTDEELSHDGAD